MRAGVEIVPGAAFERETCHVHASPFRSFLLFCSMLQLTWVQLRDTVLVQVSVCTVQHAIHSTVEPYLDYTTSSSRESNRLSLLNLTSFTTILYRASSMQCRPPAVAAAVDIHGNGGEEGRRDDHTLYATAWLKSHTIIFRHSTPCHPNFLSSYPSSYSNFLVPGDEKNIPAPAAGEFAIYPQKL